MKKSGVGTVSGARGGSRAPATIPRREEGAFLICPVLPDKGSWDKEAFIRGLFQGFLYGAIAVTLLFLFLIPFV